MFKNINLFLFDMDGTLYLGNKIFPFTIELLKTIKQKGKRYMFMTNNSSKSVNAYIKKLYNFGIDATKEDFITSSQATIYYLKKYQKGARLYVSGTESLKQELCENGFTVSDSIDDIDCIVMGYDTELNYKKLWDISYMLTTRDVHYIATNPDYVCPTEWGSVPDCGSICEMIFNCTGKRPRFIGKPDPLMPILAMEMTGTEPSKTAVIGDRIYTDIKSGLNAGVFTVLVMSGETTEKILRESPDKPDAILKNAGEIIKTL